LTKQETVEKIGPNLRIFISFMVSPQKIILCFAMEFFGPRR